MVDLAQALGVGQVVRDGARLLVGDVLELVRRRDVTEGPDPLDVRPAEAVDGDPAVAVGLDPRRGQPEVGGVRLPAGGDQQQVGVDGAAVGEVQADAEVVAGRADHVAAEPDVPPGGRDLGEAVARSRSRAGAAAGCRGRRG